MNEKFTSMHGMEHIKFILWNFMEKPQPDSETSHLLFEGYVHAVLPFPLMSNLVATVMPALICYVVLFSSSYN
jgi:hypothetical protein